MPRRLKTYTTAIGFFELAVAAPSMKAALESWGSRSNLFHQGFAHETDDPAIVKAAMAQPGAVLRRPVGSRGIFKERAGLPKISALQSAVEIKPAPSLIKKPPLPKTKNRPSEPAGRKAAELYDLARKRREREEKEARDRQEKENARRAQAIEKAAGAIDAARATHHKRKSAIEKERAALELRDRDEDDRWNSENARLEAALKHAQEPH